MDMNHMDYKEDILKQIEERNKLYNKFSDLIISHTKLYERNKELQRLNVKFKDDIDKLKFENQELSAKAHAGTTTVERSEQTAVLEQKLFRVQEELTEVHRTKGARAQQIIDLNIGLQEKEREVATCQQSLKEKDVEVKKLTAQVVDLEQKYEGLKQANQTLKDEYQALHITYEAVDEKLRRCQMENRDLIERWMRHKDIQAETLNYENDKIQKVIADKTTASLMDAMQSKDDRPRKDSGSSQSSSVHPNSPPSAGSTLKDKISNFFGGRSRSTIQLEEESASSHYTPVQCSAIVRLPQDVICRWKAHENEVTSTRFSFSGGLLATGGSDKFIHIWNFFGDKSRLQSTLRGSNGGITSIDFDPQEQFLAASSNDFACRIWTVSSQRMKLTLTGHSGKVLSNRFLASSHKLASGSSDRTVKVWDVSSGACTRTFMAGSSCNDIVAADSSECLASGHFDKKIRVWDARVSSQAQNEIVVGGRVTSLDMPVDKTSLICCTKDHTLELIDLRKSSVRNVFSHDSFKVATDQARCAYSTDGCYVAVGSSDGSVISWNVKTGDVASVVREHSDPVISCNWNGGRLVSGDKNKTCILWTEF